ncbi:MAG: hypothetical protein IBJ09_09835 [Bacteroidia bacterium]|nr:hypothetical protein [Bacteroidia bacterium]
MIFLQKCLPRSVTAKQHALSTRLLPLLFCMLIQPALYAQDALIPADSAVAPRVLIIGDSHLVGDFGEYLHRKIHKLDMFDVISLGIGGAGTMHFTQTLKNFCCGYKIRESRKGEIIADKAKVRVLERSGVYTGEVILKNHGGKLGSYLKVLLPDYLIIALGSNYTNAHDDLIKIIQTNAPSTHIIWVGPFRRSRFSERIDPIIRTTTKYKIPLVRSDDVVGNDTLTSAHFYGKTALRWAEKVTERLKPHLEK